MKMVGDVLTVERTINTTPEVVFAFLTDASNHSLIDGSGMVRGIKPGTAEHLAPGVTFGMGMKVGLRYSTVNRVVEFDTNRTVAWKTGPEGMWGKLVGGRVWRYELEAVSGGTLVKESWDITTDHQRGLLKLGGIYSGKTRKDMERTLERLNQLLVGDGR